MIVSKSLFYPVGTKVDVQIVDDIFRGTVQKILPAENKLQVLTSDNKIIETSYDTISPTLEKNNKYLVKIARRNTPFGSPWIIGRMKEETKRSVKFIVDSKIQSSDRCLKQIREFAINRFNKLDGLPRKDPILPLTNDFFSKFKDCLINVPMGDSYRRVEWRGYRFRLDSVEGNSFLPRIIDPDRVSEESSLESFVLPPISLPLFPNEHEVTEDLFSTSAGAPLGSSILDVSPLTQDKSMGVERSVVPSLMPFDQSMGGTSILCMIPVKKRSNKISPSLFYPVGTEVVVELEDGLFVGIIVQQSLNGNGVKVQVGAEIREVCFKDVFPSLNLGGLYLVKRGSFWIFANLTSFGPRILYFELASTILSSNVPQSQKRKFSIQRFKELNSIAYKERVLPCSPSLLSEIQQYIVYRNEKFGDETVLCEGFCFHLS